MTAILPDEDNCQPCNEPCMNFEKIYDDYGIGCAPATPDPFCNDDRAKRKRQQPTQPVKSSEAAANTSSVLGGQDKDFCTLDSASVAPAQTTTSEILRTNWRFNCQPNNQMLRCGCLALGLIMLSYQMASCRRRTDKTSPFEYMRLALVTLAKQLVQRYPALSYLTWWNLSLGLLLSLTVTALILSSVALFVLVKFLERMARTARIVQMFCFIWLAYKLKDFLPQLKLMDCLYALFGQTIRAISQYLCNLAGIVYSENPDQNLRFWWTSLSGPDSPCNFNKNKNSCL